MEGISRKYIENHLNVLAKKGAWDVFNRVLALLIYGVIIFPSSIGIIDLTAISVFQMVEHHHVNPIPAILADTYMTLTQCHLKQGGKIRCCLALLSVWIFGHLYGKEAAFRKRHDPDCNPLTTFRFPEGSDRHKWKHVFSQLKEDSILWKLEWWLDEEIIYCCNGFSNVPLMGPRGCINYNPSVALRQLAFQQRVPSEEEVQGMHFNYNETEKRPLCQKIRNAWQEVVYKGKIELGKRTVNATSEYTAWLKDRMSGLNPTYAPKDPVLGNNAREIKEQLTKQLQAKEAEIDKLTEIEAKNREEVNHLQNECTKLRKEVAEVEKRKNIEATVELKRLKRENMKLRDAAESSESKWKSDKAKLVRVTKEKEALEKRMQGLRPPSELQQEINLLTEQLEKKMNEIISIRGSAAEAAQSFIERLNQQTEAMEGWRTMYFEQTHETNQWRERLRKLIILANSAIPEFVETFKRAENIVTPIDTPVEITDFFSLCKEIIEELRAIANF